MKTYRISPLKWKRRIDITWQDHAAETIFGTLHVERHREGYEDTGEWTGWKWNYCFTEYYDEGSQECESLKAGKAADEAFYLSRLLGALEEV